MTVDHYAVMSRLSELRATAEAAESGSSSPWVVEYFATKQRITNGAALIIAETFVGSPLPGHKALWAPEPEHIAAWSPAHSLRWIAWAEQVAAEHEPLVETVEWWDSTDGTGAAPICGTCGNREPNEWELGVGNYGVKPDGWVSPYVLWPCSTYAGLAGALGPEET